MVEGVIFDMDGLMFDTEPLWTDTWPIVLPEFGYAEVPAGLPDACRGSAGEVTNRIIRSYLGEDADAPAMRVRMREEVRKMLEKGVDIGGFVTSPADVHLLKHDRNSTIAEIVIHEGKNRQVRRMFKAIGHPVLELRRTGLGNLEIGRLAEGQCRRLSPAEVEQLRRI